MDTIKRWRWGIGSLDGQKFYPPVMDRQRGLYCAKKDMALRWIHVVVVAHGTVHSRGVPSPGPSSFFSSHSFLFALFFLFGVDSLAFDSCSVLTLIFFFIFHFCLLLQSGRIRWLLRISVGEKGWCVSTTFFPSYHALSLLGYFRIVFFFLSGHMVLRLQFARAFENGSRV